MFALCFANIVSAQDEVFEKEYSFPLAADNGKCVVSGLMDFSTVSTLDDDVIFTNLYSWICDNIGRDKVLKLQPSNKVISFEYSIKDKNTYYIPTAFRVVNKQVVVSQMDIKVVPALSFNNKEVGIEKYAALKRPTDKNVIDEFNALNNDILSKIKDFTETNVPESRVASWDNIVAKRVVEGMTMTETKLALGEPRSVVESNNETQWIYGLSLIVYFKADAKRGGQKTVFRILR